MKLKIFQLSASVFILLSSIAARAQEFFPPHWYRGMQHDTLYLIVHSEEAFAKAPTVRPSSVLIESTVAENSNYAFLKIHAHANAPGNLQLKWNGKKHPYRLKERTGVQPAQFNQQDVMYLITPDRFANADTTNDGVAGMNEMEVDRSEPFARHGGDVQGIINRLDYLDELGISSLWVSPLLTNDQSHESYHGYAITDHFNIDPRMGDNELYAELVDQMHERDMKMVMDVIYNHFGSEHLFFREIPDSNFFNFHDDYLRTSYRATTLLDPNVAESDKFRFTDGWFDGHMPDVNARNEWMAQYLIQHSIWWIENFGVDAFRIDTYTYPDQKFMSRLADRILAEYPGFFFFGETWVHGPEIQSYFVKDNPFNPINSHMPAVTDFQLHYALVNAPNNKQGWTDGVAQVYYTLAADYLYPNPELLVTFLDNHDLARIYGVYGGDIRKMKVGLGMLLTLRGIPCIYYGTEIGMSETENHGLIREDFPGGWAGDTANAFTEEGRTEEQNQIFNYLEKLLDWRSGSKAITGEFTQFIPEDNIYVYFRHTENDTLMIAVNTDPEKAAEVELERYRELWPVGSEGIEIISDEKISGDSLSLPAMSIKIIQQN